MTASPGSHDGDVGLPDYVGGWMAHGHPGYHGYAWYRLIVRPDGTCAIVRSACDPLHERIKEAFESDDTADGTRHRSPQCSVIGDEQCGQLGRLDGYRKKPRRPWRVAQSGADEIHRERTWSDVENARPSEWDVG